MTSFIISLFVVLLIATQICDKINAAVFSIRSSASGLYLCAQNISSGSNIILFSNNTAKDSSGNHLCFWNFDSIGRVYFAGIGNLLISTGGTSGCSNQTLTLSPWTGSTQTQTFGWVNSQHGETLRSSGGYGACSIDTLGGQSGSWVQLRPGGSNASQALTTATFTCSSGFFWNQDPAYPVCNICPIGSYCIGQLADKVQCAAGTYSLSSGRSVCSSCEKGFYCTGGANKVACPATNFNTVVGATSSAACDAPHSIQAVNSNLFVCAASNNSASVVSLKSDPLASLSTCWWYVNSDRVYLSGSTGLLMNSQDSTTCRNSAFILSSDSGSAANQTFGWIKTASGFMLVNGGGSGACAMDNGNQPAGGNVFAVSKSGTSTQSYVRRSFSCSSFQGTYWNQDINNPACLPCPIGSFCPGGNAQATVCPAGTYTSTQSSLSCSLCEPGYFCSGGSGRSECPAGTTSSDPGLTSASGCKICKAGYYCTATALTETGVCPPGTFSFAMGIGSILECAICDAGHYCAGGNNRKLCDPGYYCDAGTSVMTTLCPPGTYSLSYGRTSVSDCVTCEGGYYCAGGSHRSICSAGYYCDAGTSVQTTSCPVGTYSKSEGAASVAQCAQCEAGYYCTGGSNREVCPAGFYCERGTGSVTTRCPPGKYSTSTGLTSSAACTTCEAGYFCTGGSNRQVCAAGYYCNAGTSVLTARCPPGTYSLLTGLSSVAACTRCEAGYYCSGGTNHNLCDPGYYCAAGTTVETTLCPAGTYSLTFGLTSITGCIRCEVGYACSGGNNRMQCTAGSVSPPGSSYCAGTRTPTGSPTSMPSAAPTFHPTMLPTFRPTSSPTSLPTYRPTSLPTHRPSYRPSSKPTFRPSQVPTFVPSAQPTSIPSPLPTYRPSFLPSFRPTYSPSSSPSQMPTELPSSVPTSNPSFKPTKTPTAVPTSFPTYSPTAIPSIRPSFKPTYTPTIIPSFEPTSHPTLIPTASPTFHPSFRPTSLPTKLPTFVPTSIPTCKPSFTPSVIPTFKPSMYPSSKPTELPTYFPSSKPSSVPTSLPSPNPTSTPSYSPSVDPSSYPTVCPTELPTFNNQVLSVQVESASVSPEIWWWLVPVCFAVCFIFCLAAYCCIRRLIPCRKLKALAILEYSYHTSREMGPSQGDPIDTGYDCAVSTPRVSSRRTSEKSNYFFIE